MSPSQRPSARDALIEAGFQVLSRNPSAGLADIAETAGVGRATLHRYFPSREAFVSALAQLAIREMDDAVENACADSKTAGEALRDSFLALIPLGDRHGFLAHESLEHDPAIQAEFARLRRETVDLVAAAQEEGFLDAAVPTDWIVRAFDYLLYAAWESVRTDEATAKQAADVAWRTLTSGLGARA